MNIPLSLSPERPNRGLAAVLHFADLNIRQGFSEQVWEQFRRTSDRFEWVCKWTFRPRPRELLADACVVHKAENGNPAPVESDGRTGERKEGNVWR